MLQRWTDFRRRQRAALRESNQYHHESDEQLAHSLIRETLTGEGGESVEAGDGAEAGGDERPAGGNGAEAGGGRPVDAGGGPARGPGPRAGDEAKFGTLGRPLNRQSPFYLGFFGATGALIAIGLWQALDRLTTTLTILVVAIFLTLALDPLVAWLVRRGLRRATSVAVVFAGVLVIFILLGFVVVPPVVGQATELTKAAPDYLQSFIDTTWVKKLDHDYGIVQKVQEELTKHVQDPNFLNQVFGGVLGAGLAVANGVFQAFTVLVLTLFFLASLPTVKQSAYDMVPASRRPRVASLSEEIMRRAGSYALGQVAVATTNAVASFIMISIVGVPYAAVLAVAVGFLGLVPMVGASLGAAVVCLVALFDEPRKAVILLVYYVVYQQLENYLVAPRIMQRTVSVPGAITVVAALTGASLLGMLGALLAIPVAAGLLLLYEEVLLPRQRQH